MSFRTRIAVLIAAVVAVVVAAVAGVFLYMARGKALDSLDGKLRTRAASAVQLGDKLGRPQEFDRRLFGQYLPDDVLLQVFDTRGRIWASNVEPLPPHALHESPRLNMRGAKCKGFIILGTSGIEQPTQR